MFSIKLTVTFTPYRVIAVTLRYTPRKRAVNNDKPKPGNSPWLPSSFTLRHLAHRHNTPKIP